MISTASDLSPLAISWAGLPLFIRNGSVAPPHEAGLSGTVVSCSSMASRTLEMCDREQAVTQSSTDLDLGDLGRSGSAPLEVLHLHLVSD